MYMFRGKVKIVVRPNAQTSKRVFCIKMYQYFIYKIYCNLKMKRSLETSRSTNINPYIIY